MSINAASLARSSAIYMGAGAAIDLAINGFSKGDAPKPTVSNVGTNMLITAALWAGIGAAFHGAAPMKEAAIVGAIQGAALSLGMNGIGQGASHALGI
jgi:hypothetical protein